MRKVIGVTKANSSMATLAVLAVAAYALLWIAWAQQWAWLGRLDSPMLSVLHDYGVQHPFWVTSWNVFCTVLGPSAFRLVGLVLAVVALVRRRWRVAIFVAVSIGLSGPLSVLAKSLADRPRPSTYLVDAPSSSFPSGHAVGVMVGVLALLALLPPSVDGWRRVVALALGAVVVTTIGVGRVVLNVHHPSDVLAGWALGYLYFYLCLRLLTPTPGNDSSPAHPESA